MKTQETIELFNQYVIANYGRLPRVMVKGEGCYIWDADGNKILDMFPGWAVSGIGHCPPKVVEAVRKQVGELIHMDNTFYSEPQGRFAQMLSERAFGGKCFFCNSGAEANEAALKLARLYTPKEKYKFITCEGSFHGRTFATVTATAQPKYHEGFLPLLPGFVYIPFNDVKALEAAFTDEVAAVLVEPIQGEGGINVATPEFLQAIRRLCDQKGAVMILDEVQTRHGPDRQVVRLPALRRRAGHHHDGQDPRRRRRDRRDDGQGRSRRLPRAGQARLDLRRQLPRLRRRHRDDRDHRRRQPAPARGRDGPVRPGEAAGAEGEARRRSTTSGASG